MFAMKADGGGVVGMEKIVGVDSRVGITEKSPYVLLVLVVESLKAVFRYLLIRLYQCLGNDEILHPIQSGIREVLGTHHAVCFHRLTHL